MKIKKISKKFSIFAMALALAFTFTPSSWGWYYEPIDNPVGQSINLRLAPLITIEKATGANTTAVVNVVSETSLSMTTPISISYNVSSNGEGKVKVSATAPVSDVTGTVNALFGTAANAMTIVFTRNNSTAASSAVTNASSASANSTSNIDAIAFTFTPETPTATLGTAPTLSIENNALIYEIDEGSFNLPFKVDGTSHSGTFSPDDSAGNYTATLIISEIDG